MNVVIIDYGSGNLRSVAKAFERAGGAFGLTVCVTADARALGDASHVVLPGVGAFADCKRGLEAVAGMAESLTKAVLDDGKPFLGICVGMQLMASVGCEHGRHRGLGWIAGEVVPLQPSDPGLKIPHMGWNELSFSTAHPVFDGLREGAHAYFVHSYAFDCDEPADRLASVDYGGPVTAAVGRGNMIGTQFHPEKSQATGLRIIGNFLGWKP